MGEELPRPSRDTKEALEESYRQLSQNHDQILIASKEDRLPRERSFWTRAHRLVGQAVRMVTRAAEWTYRHKGAVGLGTVGSIVTILEAFVTGGAKAALAILLRFLGLA